MRNDRRPLQTAGRTAPGCNFGAIASFIGSPGGYLSRHAPKDEVRRSLEGDGPRGRLALPGAEGRIPNFAGPNWLPKSSPRTGSGNRSGDQGNPDSPQTHAAGRPRRRQTMIMAVPRLRDPIPSASSTRKALESRGQGGGDHKGGSSTPPSSPSTTCPRSTSPLRLGGGHLSAAGSAKAAATTTLSTGSRRRRRQDRLPQGRRHHRPPDPDLRQHLMVTAHDLPCDLIATPRAVIEVEAPVRAPPRILWDHCSHRRSARSRLWNGWAYA